MTDQISNGSQREDPSSAAARDEDDDWAACTLHCQIEGGVGINVLGDEFSKSLQTGGLE